MEAGGLRQRLSMGGVARGALFLFLGSLTTSILGYVYWVLISVFGGAEVVGITSSTASLSTLASGIAVLGIPVGVRRFFGREFASKKTIGLNTYFWSSLIFVVAACLLSAIVIWTLAILDIPLIGFSQIMLVAAGLMTFLGFSGLIESLFISTSKTEYTAASHVVSSITQVASGVFFLHMGLGWVGALMGIVLAAVALATLMLFFALRQLKHLGSVRLSFSFRALRESLHAGSVSWLPGVIAVIGQQLSILTVFSLQGDVEAGKYFIAYLIFSIVYLLPASFMSILFPLLSGLTEGSRRVAWRALRICLAIACPPVVFIMFYSQFPLSLIGSEYVHAAPILSLLVSSVVPLTFVSAVSSLVYASGSYGKVLGIGLAVNAPRVILYFVLVPVYSGLGAALSFLIGTVTGLLAAIYVSKVADFRVSSRKITITIVAPLAAALLCLIVGLNWLIGGTIILLTSVFCYGRSGVVERSDLAEIARAFASEKTIAKAGERLNWLLKMIYGE